MKLELLAPAGSYESMKAAISAGADAVYMGGMKFGARAYAKNGEEDELIDAIHHVHLRGKKLYLTVNTLLKNRELETELYDYLRPLYLEGLDAVIVQDPGVLDFVKYHFPMMHIHASTQMTITGENSASLMEEMGCSRIVTARELSLDDIRAIRSQTNIEIESFVHGALCYCYSGQCLMSSLFGGRSGNRGRCAQPCRLPYTVYDPKQRDAQPMNGAENRYVLSPKDMNTIDLLPQIIEAGVTSLKIEGRMKKPEYTAGVVSVYRKYLDLSIEKPDSYQVSADDQKILYDLYNRDGFNKSYYQVHNGPEMMAMKNEKESKGQKSRDDVLFQKIRDRYMDTPDQISLKGVLKLHAGQPITLTLENQTVTGKECEKAKNQPLSRDRVKTQIEKTGGTDFSIDALAISMDDNIFVPMQALNEVRRQALDAVKTIWIQQSKEGRAESLVMYSSAILDKATESDKNKTENKQNDFDGNEESKTGFWVTVETKEQLSAALDSSYIQGIYAALTLFLGNTGNEEMKHYIQTCMDANISPCLALPHIVRRGDLDAVIKNADNWIKSGLQGFLVRSLEALALLRQNGLASYTIADANLYTYNKRAQMFYGNLDILRDTAPLELNGKELAHRDNSRSEMIVYGYIPLMVSSQCVKKNLRKCTGNSDVLTLRDRYEKNFCVKCVCDFCYNIIYNSLPLGLLKERDQVNKLGFQYLRLQFTTECEKETASILDTFGKSYFEKILVPSDGAFTKGHFKRGVE